ncbi:McrB family protein [Actinomadura algeriensis]|uniref:5-methylcytosine-specific restriction protein B n=1 Tax=Actinomadura algeriensis TaxID=1679523 RepID=A0ABR9JIS8_9ACTN|nr:AAA family ATPase [Actinomadura algeriensis]MBE1530470.1 5-methylcytosine-specific restriction protein B [Actinomadura algeriensis]
MPPIVSIKKEAANGHKIVHYDGQVYELTPSPGEVICAAGTGTALHHRRDCTHIAGTEDGWRVYPDADGDLWRRLLESGALGEAELRRKFAAAAGLLNGSKRPVDKVCGTCALVQVGIGGVQPPKKALSTAIDEFDRAALAERLHQADQEIAHVQTAFPVDAWPAMPLKRYALGTPDSKGSFCYAMEFGTPALCSMKGGHAGKHLIYWRQNDDSWYIASGLGHDDEQDAWSKVRAGFVAALAHATNGDLAEIDGIDALRSGPALTAKAISCYFPDAILPVTSRDHVRAFIYHLSGDNASSLDAFAAHERLKELVEADGRFDGWHPYEIGLFLYEWADPRPPSRTVLKVAPGEKARLWDDCLAGGYICVGWDDVGDLTTFTSEDEYRARFEEAYGDSLYNGFKSKISAKANELWRLYQLEPGDLVVANEGNSKVLAVGTVTQDGYRWLPEREEYRHTVAVDWDTSYAQTLAESHTAWGTVTVARVSTDLWKTIVAGKAGPTPPAPPVPSEPLFEKIAALLERKGQAVLYGPPGTGKTYASLRFALWWLATRMPELALDPVADYGTAEFRRALDTLSESGHLTQVTFHPAYGYEDFIEGYRPDGTGGDGLRLALRDGIFMRVCEAAAIHPERPYLVLIDEINRGDIPKILGELITLLEPDKRGLHVTLPTGRRFAVPPNVRIVGTMNTADRSIRLLDSALRRRFAFYELLPDADDVLYGRKVGDLDLGLLLRELNRRVVAELGRERQIGHSFFLSGGRAVDEPGELAAVIRTEVMPLLQKYAYDDYSLLARFLGERIVDVRGHTVTDLEDDALVDALTAEFGAAVGDR